MYLCSPCTEVDGQRYIKSFDVDLMDGVVLSCVMTAYIPSLVSCLLSLHHVISSPVIGFPLLSRALSSADLSRTVFS